MNKFIYYVVFFFLCWVAVISMKIIERTEESNECSAKGGFFINTDSGNKCVKLEIIK